MYLGSCNAVLGAEFAACLFTLQQQQQVTKMHTIWKSKLQQLPKMRNPRDNSSHYLFFINISRKTPIYRCIDIRAHNL